jgi:predicted TIM-barrel fold metal-dependent hydrolase
MERRGFIKQFAMSSTIGLSIGNPISRSREDPEPIHVENQPIIEWNAHIFSADISRYPFHSKGRYQPTADRLSKTPLADYLEHMDDQGIDRAVLVHPEPYGDDHTLVLDCLAQDRSKWRGTSLFFPWDTTAPQKLEALVHKEPHIVSTRFHALKGNEMYLNSFADEGVRALWKKAVDLDLIIELHIGPSYAFDAGQTIAAFPGCKVIIDHLAEPHLGTPIQYAHVLDLAKYPNVYMKLSGLNHFADDEPYYESALSFTNMVIQTFGPNQMVWGSGTPDIVDKHLHGYSDADRAKVKGGNIRKLLDW